jgi:hypothetical protein
MAKARAKTSRNGAAGFSVLAAATLLLATAVFLRAPILPLQDFNEWIYQGALVHDVLAGHPGRFALKPWPVPNALCQFLLGLMMFALSPLAAGKVFIAAYVLGFGALCWRLCRRADGATDHAAFVLLVCVAVLNTDFWSGYLNFQLGLLLLGLHLLWARDGRRLPWWQEALFALLMFFAHALTLAMLAVHIGWRAAQQRGLVRGTLRVIAVMLPALVLAAWYSRADHDYGEYIPAQGQGMLGSLMFKAYTLAKYGPYQNMIFGAMGDMQRHFWLYVAGCVFNGVFAVLAFLPLLVASLSTLRARRAFPEIMTALTGLAAFLVLPSTMFGVVNIGSRFLVPAILFALVSTPDWRGLRRLAAGFACVMPLMVLYVAHLEAQPVTGAEVDHLAVTDPAQRTKWLFWHRAFEFRDSAVAAHSGDRHRRLGFTTSILMAR